MTAMLLAACALAGQASASERKITGLLKSLDGTKKTLQIGDKELEVSRKTVVEVDSKLAAFSDLKVGQTATVTYDDELEIVKSVVVGSPNSAASSPELVQLAELGSGRFSMPFWVSSDGLTIYWEGGETAGTVFTASRESTASLFSEPKAVVKGRHPTLTADGLTLIVVAPRADGSKDSSLQVAVRTATNKQFSRPTEIKELRTSSASPKNPGLSSDGLNLTFILAGDGDGNNVQMLTERENRTATWSKPERIPFADQKAAGNLTWIEMSDDGLTLLSAEEGTGTSRQKGNFIVWQRKNSSDAFQEHSYVSVRGLPALAGRCPRYVSETKELYFARNADQKWLGIWVVKGFEPSKR